MFGNRTGWIISAVIVVVFAVLMYALYRMMDPSDPTDFASDPKNLAALQLPVPAESVDPHMTAPGDAADKYREAIDDVENHPQDYKAYSSKKTPTLKGVLAIVEAGPIKEMHLFSKKPSEVMNYKADKDAIDNLIKAAAMTGTTALALANAEKYDEALKFAEADFSLGVKLFNERITYEELVAGLGEMDRGARVIKSVSAKTGNPTRATQCDAFVSETANYDKKYVKPLHAFTKTLDPAVLATRAGDVFLLAKKSNERMWRTEALLQLGRMRFSVGEGRAADQHYSMRLLRQFAVDDKDPIVREAAVMGRDLDLPTYNLQTASQHASN